MADNSLINLPEFQERGFLGEALNLVASRNNGMLGGIADMFVQTDNERAGVLQQEYYKNQIKQQNENIIKGGIAEQRELAKNNLSTQLTGLLQKQGLTDKQIQTFTTTSPQFANILNLSHAVRLRGLKDKDQKHSAMYKKFLEDNDFRDENNELVYRKDGKEERITLNQDNLAMVNNSFNQQLAEQASAFARSNAHTTMLSDMGINDSINNLATLNRDYAKSEKMVRGTFESAPPVQQRIYSLNTGINNYMQDGKLDEAEKMDVLNQLNFLSERIGYKGRLDEATGKIYVKVADGTEQDLATFQKEILAPQDSLSEKIKSLVVQEEAYQKALAAAKAKAKAGGLFIDDVESGEEEVTAKSKKTEEPPRPPNSWDKLEAEDPDYKKTKESAMEKIEMRRGIAGAVGRF